MKRLFTIKVFASCVLSLLLAETSFSQCAVSTGPTNDCTYGDAIDNFTIGTTTASNSGCTSGSGYSVHTNPVFNFTADVTYPFSAAVGGNTYDQGIAIWIDLNNNGLYESTEQVYASTTAALSHSGSVTIPSTFSGIVGGTPLPMRVMCVYNQTIPAANACTSNQNTYGETEDYLAIITIPAPSNVSATAVFEPVSNDCGEVSDTVKVTVSNLTVTDEVNVPVELHLTGMITGSYYDTIPSLLGNTTQDLMMAVINSQAGGTLDAELIVALGDDDSTDDTLNVSISIIDATDLSISGDSVSCEGDSVDFMVNNVTTGETYSWYVDGTFVNAGNTFNTGALSATAEVVAMTDNTCRANDTLTVSVNPLPTASYTQSVLVDMVDLTATATDYDTIYWDFGDGNMGTGLNVQHTYSQNGDYLVCFYAVNECDTVEFCDTVSIETIGLVEFENGSISIFPNPTSDVANVSLTDLNSDLNSWQLIDMQGKELQTGQIKSTDASFEVKLGTYAPGTYILKLHSSSKEVYQVKLLRH